MRVRQHHRWSRLHGTRKQRLQAPTGTAVAFANALRGQPNAVVIGPATRAITLKAGVSGTVSAIDVVSYGKVKKDQQIGSITTAAVIAEQPAAAEAQELPGLGALVGNLFRTTGLYGFIDGQIRKD